MTLSIRELDPDEPVAPLTALLHRAYARLGAMGLNYTAVAQDDAVTARRARKGACLVAELDGRLVGTLAVHGKDPESECRWFRRDDVVVLEQFAVELDAQGQGVGSALMDEAERRCRERGAAFAVGDTASPAAHLIAMYEARGYAIVDTVQWPGKVYRSVVLAKPMSPPTGTSASVPDPA